MFYTRDKDDSKIVVEELYTACPVCGKEFDAMELIRQDSEICLYSTQVYCEACVPKPCNGLHIVKEDTHK